MAAKRITLDLEAYDRLQSVRREGESLSETIKRVIVVPLDSEAWRRLLEGQSLSEQAAEAIEEQIRQRHRPSTRIR